MYQDVHHLISDRYRGAHGAVATTRYPRYCVVTDDRGPRAVVGYRHASDGPLFLESYLDQPVEAVVSDRFGRRVSRESIVELGSHASSKSRATIALWAEAADTLGHDHQIGVAVLTAQLRSMFRRIGLPIIEIAAANASCLSGEQGAWGHYYAADPIVCAGEIWAARAALSGWNDAAGRRA